MEIKFLWICVWAFAGVWAVLAFLAIALLVIKLIFPDKKMIIAQTAGSDDAALYAAVTSTYARLYPGMRVSEIKEVK